MTNGKSHQLTAKEHPRARLGQVELLELRTLLSAGQIDASSRAGDFVQLGQATYFIANDYLHGQELWRTDGTQAGTSMVKDAQPGPASGAYRLWKLGNSLLFSGPAGLWKSDGTAQGAANISSVVPYGNPTVQLGSELWFNSRGGTSGLYKTDGTANGTVLVKSFYDLGFIGAANGSVVYLAADTANSAYYLWSTSGSTGDSTKLVSGVTSSAPYGLTTVVLNDNIYFFDESHPPGFGGLLKTDGTVDGTIRIFNQEPASLSVAAGHILFTVSPAFGQPESHALWKSDGTPQGTSPLLDLPDVPRNLTSAGDRSFFTVGSQLWVTDGTTAGTTLVKDIGFSQISHLFADDNGNVYEFGNTNIWRSDGTVDGTVKLGDFDSSVTVGLLSATPIGDQLYFGARATHGWEPWIADSRGVRELMDVNTQPPAAPFSIQSANGIQNGVVHTSKPAFYIRTDDDPTELALFVDGVEVVRQKGSQYFDISVPSALSQGKHIITAAAACAGGVLGPQSAPFTITVDDPTAAQPPTSPPIVVRSSLTSGILRITGTDSTDQILLRRNASDSTRIELIVNGTVSGSTYLATDVTSIIIDGRGGNDRIVIEASLSIATKIYGGVGDDTIFGGGGADRIYGGDGNDWMTGNAGNDVLYGEAGNDRIFGGDGKDYIDGGAGSNVLRGERGQDRIFALKTNDDFRGNAGDLITQIMP